MRAALGRIVNRAIQPTGYQLALLPVPPAHSGRGRVVVVRIAGFPIRVPETNPIATVYTEYPGYNGSIGRTAARLRAKYHPFGFVDVGDTAAIVRRAVPDAVGLCVEGDPAVFRLLQENVSQFPGVTPKQAFLGEREESIRTDMTKSGWNTTLLPAARGAGREVRLTTLDALSADHPAAAHCRLVKVDVEGYDVRVLRGGEGLLRATRPAVHFEYNRVAMAAVGADELAVFGWLRGLGYEGLLVWDSDGRFILAASLADSDLLYDLHAYADGRGGISYLDLCAFHAQDADVAHACTADERAAREVR